MTFVFFKKTVNSTLNVLVKSSRERTALFLSIYACSLERSKAVLTVLPIMAVSADRACQLVNNIWFVLYGKLTLRVCVHVQSCSLYFRAYLYRNPKTTLKLFTFITYIWYFQAKVLVSSCFWLVQSVLVLVLFRNLCMNELTICLGSTFHEASLLLYICLSFDGEQMRLMRYTNERIQVTLLSTIDL